MYTFELPDIGEGVVEGEIVQWLVSLGDKIAVDQPVCEIMTDKATVEISTPQGGRVTKLYGEAGDIIRVHSPLADIETAGGATSATPKSADPAPVEPVVAPEVLPEPPPATASVTAAKRAKVPPLPVSKALATPAVRRAAREKDIDINQVAGSGKGGRVTHQDLAAFNQGAVPVAPLALPQVMPSGTEKREKIIGLRRKIAEQMVKSRFTAPHFTYVDEIDVTALNSVRKKLKARAAERGVKLTFLPFIMKALCRVFADFPNLNANVEEDPLALVVKGDINIGVATDTPQGLFVPVLHNVEQKSVLRIAAELADLTERTRTGKARLEELQGGTFTVTSVGAQGGMFATPIINHPEVAILGINRIHERPVVREGQIVVRKMLYLSSSFDHRIIDGMVAARFTTALKDILEQPESLLLDLI